MGIVIFANPKYTAIQAGVILGLDQLGYVLYSSEDWCCQPPWNCLKTNEKTLLQLAKEHLTVGFARMRFGKQWQLQSQARLDVYVDGHDNFDYCHEHASKAKICFRRENFTHSNALGFPVLEWIPIPDSARKVYTCTFLMGRLKGGVWDRTKTMEAVRDLVDIPKLSRMHSPVYAHRHAPNFMEALAESRMSISLPGAGWDTFRTWEIFRVKTTCLVCPRVTWKHTCPPAPVDKYHYLGFDDEAELREIIEEYRVKPNALLDIAFRGHSWAMKKHSCKDRAERIESKLVEGGLL